jgi:hypothetical protein
MVPPSQVTLPSTNKKGLTKSVRYLGKAQRSLLHHFHSVVNAKRSEIESIRLHSAPGVKLTQPSDILGAIVSSQIDTEDEAKGDRKVGMSFQEIIANICESPFRICIMIAND